MTTSDKSDGASSASEVPPEPSGARLRRHLSKRLQRSIHRGRSDLERLFAKSRSDLEAELSKQLASGGAEVERLVSDGKRAADEHVKALGAILESAKREREKLLGSAQIKDLVQYWDEQVVQFQKAARAFGSKSYVGCVVMAVIAIGEIALVGASIIAIDRPPQYIALVAFAAFSTWIVHIFYRLYMSNLHGVRDAEQKRLAVKSFVALAASGKLDTERASALFDMILRAPATGLLGKDVGHPIVDILAKIAGQRGKA